MKGVPTEHLTTPSQYPAYRLESSTLWQPPETSFVVLTVYQATQELAGMEFVNGGTTAAGIYAALVAKSLGRRAIAVASGKNNGFLRDLGVDEVDFVSPDSNC